MSGREPAERSAGMDCRCSCKKLLARATARGVEIKCGRCERLMLVTWPEGAVIELPGSDPHATPRRK